MANLHQLLKKPLITEKSIASQEAGKYSFVVDLNATKSQIAKTFTEIFKLKPISVNTRRLNGKIKTNYKTRQPIIKPDKKIATISVAKDQKIDLLSLNTKK